MIETYIWCRKSQTSEDCVVRIREFSMVLADFVRIFRDLWESSELVLTESGILMTRFDK